MNRLVICGLILMIFNPFTYTMADQVPRELKDSEKQLCQDIAVITHKTQTFRILYKTESYDFMHTHGDSFEEFDEELVWNVSKSVYKIIPNNINPNNLRRIIYVSCESHYMDKKPEIAFKI